MWYALRFTSYVSLLPLSSLDPETVPDDLPIPKMHLEERGRFFEPSAILGLNLCLFHCLLFCILAFCPAAQLILSMKQFVLAPVSGNLWFKELNRQLYLLLSQLAQSAMQLEVLSADRAHNWELRAAEEELVITLRFLGLRWEEHHVTLAAVSCQFEIRVLVRAAVNLPGTNRQYEQVAGRLPAAEDQ